MIMLVKYIKNKETFSVIVPTVLSIILSHFISITPDSIHIPSFTTI